MLHRFRTAVLSVAVTAAMAGTGSAAFAATPQQADGFTSPKTPVAVTAADRNSGGHDAHQDNDGRSDAHRNNEGRDDAHRGDNGRSDADFHGDRRAHRDMDHGRWYGNGWDHRGGTWYGWSWEQQCEWAWYNDPGWYNEYCG